MLVKSRAPFGKNSDNGMMISPCKLIVRRNHLLFLLYWLDRSLYSLLGLMSGGVTSPHPNHSVFLVTDMGACYALLVGHSRTHSVPPTHTCKGLGGLRG